MPYIIDAHEDLAYNAFTHGRDYTRSAVDTRAAEVDTPTPQRTGHSLLGWPEYQRGQVAVIFGTLFLAPKRYQEGPWETQVFSEPKDARRLMEKQVSYYRRLTDEHPDQFRLIRSKKDLRSVLEPWEQSPAHLPLPKPADPESEPDPRPTVTHPVGFVLLMEGAEGLREPKEMEDWYEMGVRLCGPVWAGTRLCGGTMEPGDFTAEGLELLEVMAGLGMALDISHMNEKSALRALDRYTGPVIATHANARALLKNPPNERHLTDQTIRRLVERDGVMGVLPFNRFLRVDWTLADGRQVVTLRTLAAHIDHICQIAGDARHAAIGTDFDGGFGWPAVPEEINTIADLQKLAPILADLGYTDESIADIFGQNWLRPLERTLPET
jgi:membrane dipeptidase